LELKKTFNRFKLKNTSITEIPDNVFADINFYYIEIDTNPVLTRIHTNAFNGTQELIKDISILSSPIASTGPSYDLFRALNSLHNLEDFEFRDNNITEIPDQAFDGLTKLNGIWITDGRLKTIGQNIIRNLKNIYFINFNNNQIDTIAENAFTTDIIHDYGLIIYLNNNRLNVSQMEIFRHIKYPIRLNIESNNIPYLDESIFGPILRNYNESDVHNDGMDCNDCRNVWLIRDETLVREIERNFLQCSDGLEFNSTQHFIGC